MRLTLSGIILKNGQTYFEKLVVCFNRLKIRKEWKQQFTCVTAQKMKFSIRDFLSKCDQIRIFCGFRSELSSVFCNKAVLKNCPQSETLLKKRLCLAQVFFSQFVKNFRTFFKKNTSGWLLLEELIRVGVPISPNEAPNLS